MKINVDPLLNRSTDNGIFNRLVKMVPSTAKIHGNTER
jgi:hypothetical protein